MKERERKREKGSYLLEENEEGRGKEREVRDAWEREERNTLARSGKKESMKKVA